jgi:energy-converting hydrogenase Eha subunit F
VFPHYITGYLTPIIQWSAVNINSFAKQILSIRGKQNGNRTYNGTDAVSQLG